MPFVLFGRQVSFFCVFSTFYIAIGHHVGRDGRTHGAPSSGFCLLNNVVIGAIHARTYPEINKYAVIDWDIHHGNGTEELMENDTSSFFSSIHLFTGDFFPGTGKDRDADHIVNVALKNEGIGSGSEYVLK